MFESTDQKYKFDHQTFINILFFYSYKDTKYKLFISIYKYSHCNDIKKKKRKQKCHITYIYLYIKKKKLEKNII